MPDNYMTGNCTSVQAVQLYIPSAGSMNILIFMLLTVLLTLSSRGVLLWEKMSESCYYINLYYNNLQTCLKLELFADAQLMLKW